MGAEMDATLVTSCCNVDTGAAGICATELTMDTSVEGFKMGGKRAERGATDGTTTGAREEARDAALVELAGRTVVESLVGAGTGTAGRICGSSCGFGRAFTTERKGTPSSKDFSMKEDLDLIVPVPASVQRGKKKNRLLKQESM